MESGILCVIRAPGEKGIQFLRIAVTSKLVIQQTIILDYVTYFEKETLCVIKALRPKGQDSDLIKPLQSVIQ